MESFQRGWRTSRIFFAALWIIMLAASLFLISILVNPYLSSRAVPQFTSLDWAGYVVVSDAQNPESIIVSISGSWIVPSVKASTDDTFSAVWIGVGGQLDNTLIQTGTEQDFVNGEATYSAWYELLPYDAVTINASNISPGDMINASINLLDSPTNKWSIEIEDLTKGQKFREEFFYDSSRLSAEWIVERPTVDGILSSLADFGSVAFTGATATMTTTSGTINSFPYAQVVMVDRQNRQLVTVSALASKGSSFTVAYASAVVAQSQVLRPFENKIAAASDARRFGLEQVEQFVKRRYNVIGVFTSSQRSKGAN